MHEQQPSITVLLHRVSSGDAAAEAELYTAVYAQLRRLAGGFLRRERPGHTLQATALVNEAYLRMLGSFERDWSDHAHFFRIAARVMRQILVDHARQRNTLKRTTPEIPDMENTLALSPARLDSILTIDAALERLERRDPYLVRIVELRFFGGLTEEEISLVVGTSTRTVKRDWATAKAWLRSALEDNPSL